MPRLVATLRGLPPVHQVAAGLGHTMCLLLGGAVLSWGNGANGRLGLGDDSDRALPTLVTALTGLKAPVTAVFAGASHSMAVFATGRAVAWGKNNQGQCGVGTTADQYLPAPVFFLDPVDRRFQAARAASVKAAAAVGAAVKPSTTLKFTLSAVGSSSVPQSTPPRAQRSDAATGAASLGAGLATPDEHRGAAAARTTTDDGALSAAAAAAAAVALSMGEVSGGMSGGMSGGLAARRRSLAAAETPCPPGSRQGEASDAFDRLLASPTTRSPSFLRQSLGLPDASPTSSPIARPHAPTDPPPDLFGADALSDAAAASAEDAKDAEDAAKPPGLKTARSLGVPMEGSAAKGVCVGAAGGWEHTLFLLADGSVWSCGGGYKDAPPVRRCPLPPVVRLVL